jgi:uncharacterized membrane protein
MLPSERTLSRESSAVTRLAITLHVIAGTIALFAGIVAVSSRKGAHAHRVAGTVFFVSMLVMAGFADYLAVDGTFLESASDHDVGAEYQPGKR